MGKYAIVIDSTVFLSKDIIEKNNIKVASLNVLDGLKSYKELEVDENFIWDMQDKGAHWKTSQPAPGEFLDIFEELISQGYEKIFTLLLSRTISGTHQSALLAKSMLDKPDKVHVFDSLLCAYGVELIAVELIEMVNNGWDEKDIIERTERIISTSGQLFTVENLFSLVKGGRLSSARAAIGTVLRIKPIIKVIGGKLELVKSERTHKKIHNYWLNDIKKSLGDRKKLTFYITSQYSKESATEVKDFLLGYFPGSKVTFTEALSPVFCIHVGKKGYGIAYFSE